MFAQLKIMNHRASLFALSMLCPLVLVGCASSGHERRDVPHWSFYAPEYQHQDEPLMTHSGNSGAVMFAPGAEEDGSFYAYERDLAPEYARRDGTLSVGTPDATAGWYAWPEQQRPSLDDQGRFYTSSNPNVYVYPGGDDRRYHSYSGRRIRGHRGSPYPRRRVR